MCYRIDCKEECHEMKKKYCIMKITKEQRDFMKAIQGEMSK